MCEDYVRLRRDQLFRKRLMLTAIVAREADLDVSITALGPSALFQPLPKRHKARLRFRIVFGVGHHHADAPHALGLLSPCRKRPPNRRGTSNSLDELAPPHLSPPRPRRASYRLRLTLRKGANV